MSAPLCRWCGRKLKPRYERFCKDCGHSWWIHTLRLDGHCQGKLTLETVSPPQEVPCNCGARGDLTKYPTQFLKKLEGYGIDLKGKFCTQSCAVQWANKYADGGAQ